MRSSSLQQQQPHRLITSRQKRCTFPLQPAATSTSVEEEEYDYWEVGDAQRDLEILKTAYAKSRAKDEIDEIARMDLLDEYARQRKPIQTALQRYVAGPLLVAVVLKYLFLKSSPMSSLRSIIVGLLAVNTAHFWTAIVLSPIFMLTSKCRSDIKLWEEFPVVERTYPKWHPDYEDANRTCKDHILCLLENWVSAVCGSAISGMLALFVGIHSFIVRNRWLNYHLGTDNINKGFSLRTILAMAAITQLLTRLGAASSFFQFPKLHYQLRKDQDIQPIGRFQCMLWPRTENIRNTLPVGIALDVASLLLALSIRHSSMSFLRNISRGLASFLFGLSIFGPLMHLLCLRRIVIMEKTDAVSLANMLETLSPKAWRKGYVDNAKRWRYRPLRREPVRVREAIKSAIRDDFILRGHGKKGYDTRQFRRIGPSRRELKKQQTLFARKDDDGKSAYNEVVKEVPIFQFYDDDVARGHFNNSYVNLRDAWAEEANDYKIKVHNEDYENVTKLGLDTNQTKDSLGVALQQNLDVGLSFDFDWDRRPRKGEKISMHRLRARLAQSTVRRYYQIQDNVTEYLYTIDDPEERLSRGKVIAEVVGEKFDDEFGEFVDALKTLIPTNEPSPRQFQRLNAMSASDVLALAGIKNGTLLADALADRESMVAIKGEVPSYDTDQPLIDPLSSGIVQYRKAFPSKDDNATSWDDIDDDYVNQWLQNKDLSDDDVYLA